MTETLLFKKLAAFDKEDALLISIRNQAYDGNWAEMLRHLKYTLKTKSYMVKVVNRVQDHIERVKELMRLDEGELVDILNEFGSECA